jgi:hypothetical protein
MTITKTASEPLLDADHPTNEVPIPRRSTRRANARRYGSMLDTHRPHQGDPSREQASCQGSQDEYRRQLGSGGFQPLQRCGREGLQPQAGQRIVTGLQPLGAPVDETEKVERLSRREACHIDIVDRNGGRIRALFADVIGWTNWNAGIERIELRGPFANGTEFLMQPPGMDPFVSTLSAVQPGESFTDITVLDGTTVQVHHSLYALAGNRTRVTYRAEVTGPAEAEIGPMVTGDFDDVLRALKQLAEEPASR